jgi:hypothetical protein
MGDAVAQNFLVQSFLLDRSLFVVYGESNSGKTYFVLDLALAIAAGIAWRGLRVQKGLVVYVAGEGAVSVRNRVAAFQKSRSEVGTGIPFAVIGSAVNLLDVSEVSVLIATMKRAESECGEKASLVVLDTLARSMLGGDENSAQDIGIAVAAADRIRLETGAAVCFVHHSGKDASKGARGSNALRCAVDTEIVVEGLNGTRTATVTKQRDLVCGQSFAFNLSPVDIGRDHEGQRITACVISHVDLPSAKERTKKSPKGRNQQLLLAAIREFARSQNSPIISTLDLRDIARAQGLNDRRRFSEAREVLERDGWIAPCVGGYRLQGDEL